MFPEGTKVSDQPADIEGMEALFDFLKGAVIVYGVSFVFMFSVVFWPLVCYGIASALGLDPVLADFNCHTWNGICPR